MLTTQAKRLLEATINRILAEPTRVNMDFWYGMADCSTTYCIAGWVCELSGYASHIFGLNMEEEATMLLSLTGEQAQRLFYVGHWPEQFRQSNGVTWAIVGRPAVYTIDYAMKVAERIWFFMVTEGTDKLPEPVPEPTVDEAYALELADAAI